MSDEQEERFHQDRKQTEDFTQSRLELFNSGKEASAGWKSEPLRQWSEIRLRFGSGGSEPVLQACRNSGWRSVLSKWMERKEAHHLLIDISVAQEEESSGELRPLKVHLFDTDNPVSKFPNDPSVLDLQNSKLFSSSNGPDSISSYLNRSVSLSLGPVSRRGFQLGFSYTGECVFIASIRVYYKACPEVVSNLTSFPKTAAGSEPVRGRCVAGAVQSAPPVRECGLDGAWSSQQGGCSCGPGLEERAHTCEACRIGYYKPTNGGGECQLCPPNSMTPREGSESCECLQGFSRLPSDPHDLGCSKPPSAPLNLTTRTVNDSVLVLKWDSPHDRGGRTSVKYQIKCEKAAEMGSQWEPCGNQVRFLPDSDGLNDTSVTILGLNHQLDYRLSVQAWNHVSSLQPASHSSTATLIMHRSRTVVITGAPASDGSAGGTAPAPGPGPGPGTAPAPGPGTAPAPGPGPGTAPAPTHRSSLFHSTWLTVVVLLSTVLLTAVVFVAMYFLRKNYTKLRSEPDHEMQLLPGNAHISYHPPRIPETGAQLPHNQQGAAQLLEGLGGRLLDSLKDVLVERNQLTLGKELGKGEFGSVYEGIFTPQAGADIRVAVKTMRVGIHSQRDLEEFLKEAEIMKNFDHENVVRLLGVTLKKEEDSPVPVPLVILPYMKHGDLRRFLIATRYGDIPMFVPFQTLLRFMIDIAAGMDYLSTKGFLHRDLAARNCMLGDDLHVCVADFGLSKKIYSSNYYRQTVAVRVPIKWMAIESLSESVYTTKSDVWSFGVTMWEIVSRGKTPYPAVHNYELLDLLLSGHRLKPPAECDEKLYEIMKSCWDSEPRLRPDFSNLLDELKGLLSKLPVLEACEEERYINQGLDAASAAASEDPQTDSGGRHENAYLSSPVGAEGCGAVPH
ncbi:ephrin type-A receptor 4-B isoform X2 [Gambusia affinis]|uniref:ephrin type-A receptor 4-B isoform X2 n=1 Tax=Gambusia affinis TaxID=33528 RepID=UPI001CDB9AFB|nr:ephrin type-A receptor 4-B isoform X2 [Gambusia affinis]